MLGAAVMVCVLLAGCGASGPGASPRVTTTGTCTVITPTRKCPAGQHPTSGGFLTNTKWERTRH